MITGSRFRPSSLKGDLAQEFYRLLITGEDSSKCLWGILTSTSRSRISIKAKESLAVDFIQRSHVSVI